MIPDLFYYGDFGILALRIGIGLLFIAHGTKKLDGKMGPFMTFIGISETIGGLALLAGFLTQFAALGIAVIMAGAVYKKVVEWHVPYSSSEKIGWEFDLLIIGACVALMTLGSGLFGVDAMWFY